MNNIVNISDHNIRMFADDAVLFDASDDLPALYELVCASLCCMN